MSVCVFTWCSSSSSSHLSSCWWFVYSVQWTMCRVCSSGPTSSFARLVHAVLVQVQSEEHVWVPVFFFCCVGMAAVVASSYGSVQIPTCFFWGRSSQFRLVLELRGKKEQNVCVRVCVCSVSRDRWVSVISTETMLKVQSMLFNGQLF